MVLNRILRNSAKLEQKLNIIVVEDLWQEKQRLQQRQQIKSS